MGADKTTWKRNMMLRIALLNEEVPELWSRKRLIDATGWQKRLWARYRRGEVYNLNKIRRIGWVLALPESILLTGTPSEVVSYPIPDWDWLSDFCWLDGRVKKGEASWNWLEYLLNQRIDND